MALGLATRTECQLPFGSPRSVCVVFSEVAESLAKQSVAYTSACGQGQLGEAQMPVSAESLAKQSVAHTSACGQGQLGKAQMPVRGPSGAPTWSWGSKTDGHA